MGRVYTPSDWTLLGCTTSSLVAPMGKRGGGTKWGIVGVEGMGRGGEGAMILVSRNGVYSVFVHCVVTLRVWVEAVVGSFEELRVGQMCVSLEGWFVVCGSWFSCCCNTAQHLFILHHTIHLWSVCVCVCF